MTREEVKHITDLCFDVPIAIRRADESQTYHSDECAAAKKYVMELLEQEPKIGYCKDCKWWKDSDGLYRRGCHAESKCPINRKEVFEGSGYCYMFEAKMESEV